MVLTAADESDSAIETKRWCATVVMIGVVETIWRHEIALVLSRFALCEFHISSGPVSRLIKGRA